MDQSGFEDSLLDQIVDAVDAGCRAVALYPLNPVALSLAGRIHRRGLAALGQWTIITSREDESLGELSGFRPLHLKELAAAPCDAIAITANEEKEDALRSISRAVKDFPRVILAGAAHFESSIDPDFERIRRNCLVKSYATGYEHSLLHLFQTIKYLAYSGKNGAAVEFGMFKAGTTTFIRKSFEHFGRTDIRLIGFDAFSGFPGRRSLFDLYTNPDCEFTDQEAVEHYCQRYAIEVVQGDIAETYSVLEGVPLLLTFFDTDNYSPAKAALPLVYEQTVSGGAIAFDHFHSIERFRYTIGERMAAQEFFADKPVLNLHGTGVFIKP